MPLTESDVIAHLDEASRQGWPEFTGITRTEYHALRLTVVRSETTDDWAIVFESVLGSFIADPLEEPFAASVWSTGYGPHIDFASRHGEPRDLGLRVGPRNEKSLHIEGITLEGRAGPLECRDAMIAELDLRPGMLTNLDRSAEVPVDVLLIRAYLAIHPTSFWYPQDDLVALLEVPNPRVLVVSDAFAHVLGPQETPYGYPPLDAISILPSASDTYRSVAAAIARRDGALFRPGASNVDWRNWVRFSDENAEP
jgi:hypothetical protein